MKRRLIVIAACLLCGQIAGVAFAGTADLTPEAAAKIAKEQAAKDHLPAEHLVVELIDSPTLKHRFYLVHFEPPISAPQSKAPNTFIAYVVEMDGLLRRTGIVRTIRRSAVKLPPDLGVVPSKCPPMDFLEKPYRLTLNPTPVPTSSP
jgi:hypothetical protein